MPLTLHADPDAIYTLAESYFERFGDKACCYEDLLPYIQFSGEHLSKWTAYLEKHTSTVRHNFTRLGNTLIYVYSRPLQTICAEPSTL